MTTLALINHLNTGSNCCYAPSDRYCAAGRELWLDDRVQAIADTAGIEARRYLLEQEARNNPEWLWEIKARLVVVFEGRKPRAAA